MKLKYSIIFLFFFSFLKESFAQTWPMPGAHWEYCRGGTGADFRIFEYTKDTIINSTNYQVIEQLNVPPLPYLGSVYTRYSNDTVYRYAQSQEFPFLVFNASLGDVYTTFRTNLDNFADSTCRSILPVKVTQLDTLNYGTLLLRRWELEDTLFNDIYTGSPYPSSIWDIVERIGFMNDFPFTPTMTFYGNSCFLPTDMGTGYFLSSYSDSLYSYITPYNCYWQVGISDIVKEVEFNVFPNPANNKINIVFPNTTNSTYVTIYNIWGQKVYSSGTFYEAFSFPVEEFPDGYYFLKFVNNDFVLTKTVIINH